MRECFNRLKEDTSAGTRMQSARKEIFSRGIACVKALFACRAALKGITMGMNKRLLPRYLDASAD